MSSQPGHDGRPKVYAVAFATAVAATFFALGAVTFDPEPLSWWWVPLAALVLLFERNAIHVHHRGETHSFTLSEIALVIGLFQFAPIELILARVVGASLPLRRTDKVVPVKVVFNAAAHALEASVALVIFQAFGGAAGGPTNQTLFGVIVAVAVANACTSVLIWLAIGLMTHDLGGEQLRRDLLNTVLISIALACLALSGLVIWRLDPRVAWIGIAPAAVTWLAYRRSVEEREQRRTLALLYEMSRHASQAGDLNEALESVGTRLRERLSADRVEIHLVRDGGTTLTAVAGPGNQWRPLGSSPTVDQAVAAAVASGSTTRVHDGHRVIELLTAATIATGRHVAFRVSVPLGNAVRFTDETEQLLRGLAPRIAMLIDAAELAEAKHGFLNAVSHELRTPLSVVVGLAETLEVRADVLSADQRGMATARLRQKAEQLAQLLDDLLDVDRLGRGHATAQREQVRVVDAVRRAAIALDIGSRQLHLPTGSLDGHLDPLHVTRIVDNLVSNAVKYTPATATIAVSVTREDRAVVLTVEDDGDGIPLSERERVFEPFHRLHPGHHAPGTGIGLSLVRRLAHLHGGSAEVHESELGGARFVVRLPDGRRANQRTTSTSERFDHRELSPLPDELTPAAH